MQIEIQDLSRRERERLTRRNAMLAAASEAFAEKGFADATLEDIAQRAEFGKGTLYNYFPGGKQEILLAVFEQLYDELHALIDRTFDPKSGRSFEERLEEFFFECFEFFIDRLSLFMVLMREAHRLGFSEEPTARAFFREQRQRSHEALSIPIRRAIEDGELREMAPEMFASMILTNVKGCQMQVCLDTECHTRPASHTARDLAEMLTKLLMHGAAPVPTNDSETR